MALIPIIPDDIKVSSVKVHPTQHFVSSSGAGITGDVFLFAERSSTLKDITLELEEYHFDVRSLLYVDDMGITKKQGRGLSETNISGIVKNYLDNVQRLAGSLDNDKKLIVYRFDMPHRFNANTIRKSVFIKNMLPFYQNEYEKPLSFGFSNYHSLNFFTSTPLYPSNVPSDSALIYPTPSLDNRPSRYFPSASFSFEFYINPRYTTDTASDVYPAGAILHMPNAYCISLISGSHKDAHGRPSSFRLVLQLKDYAQELPGKVAIPNSSDAGGSMDKRTFISADAFLEKDRWSHCAIRWGGQTKNNYTGSFVIDGKNAGNFVIEDTYSIKKDYNSVASGFDAYVTSSGLTNSTNTISFNSDISSIVGVKDARVGDVITIGAWSATISSIAAASFGVGSVSGSQATVDSESATTITTAGTSHIPAALFVGNRYKASNATLSTVLEYGSNTADKTALLFNKTAATNYGVEQLDFSVDAATHVLDSPLDAELQEIRIFGRWRTDEEILASAKTGYYNFNDTNFLFYLPPAFIPSSSIRRMMDTVTTTHYSSSHTPFNLDLSFGQGGRMINLENFSYDLVNGKQALCHKISEAPPEGTWEDFAADDFDFMPATEALYLKPENRKRNLTILPSDLGNHKPQLSLIDNRISALTSGLSDKFFVDDHGHPATGCVNLRDMISMGAQYNELNATDDNGDSIVDSLFPAIEVAYGPGEETNYVANSTAYGITSKVGLTVLNRTRDTDSNEIMFLDISNMFYGDMIKRESFVLRDPIVTGSAGKMQLSFCDNGLGELHRCDASGSHPTWAKVGHILYEEGLVCLMDPTIPPFGTEKINTEFRGDRNLHVMEIRIPISADEAVSSSNPTFQKLSPTSLPADAEIGCNLITNMFIHDENLNIVGKINLSRPIVRKDNDRYVFKFKIDF